MSPVVTSVCNWQVKDQPTLTWVADAGSYYTLVMNGMLTALPF